MCNSIVFKSNVQISAKKYTIAKNCYHDCEKYICEGSSAFLKNSVVDFLCRSEITVGADTIEMRYLNAMEIMGSWGSRGQVLSLNCQRQDGMVTTMEPKQ